MICIAVGLCILAIVYFFGAIFLIIVLVGMFLYYLCLYVILVCRLKKIENNSVTEEEFEKLTEEEKEIVLKNTERIHNLLEDYKKTLEKSNNVINVRAIDTKKEDHLFYDSYYTNFVIQYENGDVETKWVKNDTEEFKKLYAKIFNC